MRILFTFTGGSGHFLPLVPIARAAEAASHTVAFGGQPAMLARVEAAGFAAFDTGGDTFGASERQPLLPVDRQREDDALRYGFAGSTGRARAAAILDLAGEWRPDLIVCDEIDFGSVVAAERLGLPHATVLVIAAGNFARVPLLTEALNELRAEHGLPPDPELEMLRRYLVLSPFPPSLRHPTDPLPATAYSIRPTAPDGAAPSAAPPWLATLSKSETPTVYFTLGTVFNVESGDLFPRVLAGLRDLPINLVVTVGPHIDPAEFGPQPPHVRIEQYVPQALLLPHCDVVVSHGGSGSLIGALSHGLPTLLIPLGADQPLNAARAEALGAARVLDAIALTPAAARDAVAALLADPSYRQAAERLRDEIASLPDPAHAVPLLERLAAEKRPLTAA